MSTGVLVQMSSSHSDRYQPFETNLAMRNKLFGSVARESRPNFHMKMERRAPRYRSYVEDYGIVSVSSVVGDDRDDCQILSFNVPDRTRFCRFDVSYQKQRVSVATPTKAARAPGAHRIDELLGIAFVSLSSEAMIAKGDQNLSNVPFGVLS